MKVLIIEDESDIRKLLRAYLERERFHVYEASNGQRGLLLHNEHKYDLIILDIMIPELDGWSVCENIRKTSNVPIIIVTAKSTDSDKILGLELGADDYLVKPFSPSELIARIKALFRRIKIHQPLTENLEDNLSIGNLTIDHNKRSVLYNHSDIPLTPKEFAILYSLAKNPHKVFHRNDMLLEVWGDHFTDTRTVDAHIKTIREKFRRNGCQNIIETVWGLGYKIGSCYADV